MTEWARQRAKQAILAWTLERKPLQHVIAEALEEAAERTLDAVREEKAAAEARAVNMWPCACQSPGRGNGAKCYSGLKACPCVCHDPRPGGTAPDQGERLPRYGPRPAP